MKWPTIRLQGLQNFAQSGEKLAKKRKSMRRFWILVLTIIAAAYLIFFATQKNNEYNLEKSNDSKEEQLKGLERELTDLENQRKENLSLSVIKEYAEKNLEMHIPNPKERDFLPDPRHLPKKPKAKK